MVYITQLSQEHQANLLEKRTQLDRLIANRTKANERGHSLSLLKTLEIPTS